MLPARPLDAVDFVELYALDHDLDLPRHPSDAKGVMSDLIEALDTIDQSGSEQLAEFTVGRFSKTVSPERMVCLSVDMKVLKSSRGMMLSAPVSFLA